MGQKKTFAAKLALRRKSLKERARGYAGRYACGFVGAALLLTFCAGWRGEPLALSCLHAPMFFAAAVCFVSAILAAVTFIGLGKVIQLALTAHGGIFVPLVGTLPILTAARALAVYTPPPGIPRLAAYR